MEILSTLHPVWQGLLATLFTYSVTAVGAALVFFFKRANQKMLDGMMAFGAGVMIAASFFSLIQPAIAMCEEMGNSPWLIPSLGFVTGGLFIVFASALLDRFSFESFVNTRHSSSDSVRRSILLVAAITLHNIPEGLAVGVAFGSAAVAYGSGTGTDLVGAVLLAVGIGLQNFPEGASVSLPLRRDGLSVGKSFFFGQLSGFVEPVAGVVGVLAALTVKGILPFLLSFSAGAMIGVAASELIPEAARESKRLTTVGTVVGFTLMMLLDVALG